MVTTSHPPSAAAVATPVLALSDTPSQVLPFCRLGSTSVPSSFEASLAKEQAEGLVADGVVVGNAD